MNVAPDLNNHLRSIGLFRSRKIDQKFSIFALTSAAVLLHSPARGKKTDDSYDEHFDGEPVKSRKAGIGKILLPKKGSSKDKCRTRSSSHLMSTDLFRSYH